MHSSATQKTHRSTPHNGLAGARLANDAKTLTRRKRECHASNGIETTSLSVERDFEVTEGKQTGHIRDSRSSIRSRA